MKQPLVFFVLLLLLLGCSEVPMTTSQKTARLQSDTPEPTKYARLSKPECIPPIASPSGFEFHWIHSAKPIRIQVDDGSTAYMTVADYEGKFVVGVLWEGELVWAAEVQPHTASAAAPIWITQSGDSITISPFAVFACGENDWYFMRLDEDMGPSPTVVPVPSPHPIPRRRDSQTS
jgi:hypothetical protein